MTGRVIGFVRSVLVQEGALVDETSPVRIEALLPEALRQELELDEFAGFVEGGGNDGAVDVSYGSDGLGRITQLALGAPGRTIGARVHAAPPTVRPPKAYSGLNVSVRTGDVIARPAWLLHGVGRYVATSDDQREGLVRVSLPAASGGPIDLPELEALTLEPVDDDELPVEELRVGFARLQATLVDEAVARLAAFREAVARRHRRDAERVDQYFADVAADLDRRIAVRKDAPGLRAKLAAIPDEHRRRRAQLVANHALKVSLELLGLAALHGPGLDAELLVKRRKREVTVPARFDGLANQWAPLQCDGCGSSIFAFAMCDAAVHVLCADCWNLCGSGGHRDCFRCAGRPSVPAWKRSVATVRVSGGVVDRGVVEPSRAAEEDSPPPKETRRRTKASRDVLENVTYLLRRAKRPLTSRQIRQQVTIGAAELRALLAELIAEGRVVKSGHGAGTCYAWQKVCR